MNAAPHQLAEKISRLLKKPMLALLSLLALTVAMPISFPAIAGELLITYRHGTRPADQERFMKELAQSFNKSVGLSMDKNASDMYSDQADLNGDGVAELFVTPSGSYGCSSDSECQTSIYQKRDGDWTYIGELDSRSTHPLWGQTLKVEDTVYNGWRTITNGKQRRCYYKPEPDNDFIVNAIDKDTESRADMLGMPTSYLAGGYFWWVTAEKPCSQGWPEWIYGDNLKAWKQKRQKK